MRGFLAGLFMLGAVGLAAADDEKQSLKDTVAQIQADQAEFVKKLRAAKPADRAALNKEFTEFRTKNGEKLMEMAKASPTDAAAFGAALTAAQLGVAEAPDFLVENFAADKRIVPVLPMLAAGPKGEKNLAAVAAKTTSKDVKAVVGFLQVNAEFDAAERAPGKKLTQADIDANYRAVAAKLDALQASAEVKLPPIRGKVQTVGEAVKEIRFFIDNLTVGKVAPTVECDLLDAGKKGSLKDHAGKVVVLDIWATWCPPCRAMIPHEREMVKKLEGKKFALVSVSADDEKDTLTKFLEKEEMPWTHWWVGTKGVLLKTYQVKFYPTIYILDGKGVIRAKNIRGEEMEKMVEKLIEENEKTGS